MTKLLTKTAISVITLCVLVISPAYAKKQILTGSDWPVWETAHAMDALGHAVENFKFHYTTYGNSLQKFAAKKADAVFMTLFDYLILARNPNFAKNTSIIAVTDYSAGGDVVVVRPEIRSAAGLKGKMVALQTETLSLYLLHLTLAEKGMSLADVNLKHIKTEVIDQAFLKNQKLSAIVAWNPYAASAIERGGIKLTDSSLFPGKIVDLLVVWNDSLAGNRASYKSYLRQWFKAINDEKVVGKMAELNKVEPKEFKIWLKDATIFRSPKASLKALGNLASLIDEIDGFLAANGKNVPKRIRKFFVARTATGNPLKPSILKELAN